MSVATVGIVFVSGKDQIADAVVRYRTSIWDMSGSWKVGVGIGRGRTANEGRTEAVPVLWRNRLAFGIFFWVGRRCNRMLRLPCDVFSTGNYV